MERTYVAIDLKSFYASVECVELGLDPMTTNLVVADSSRTEKTICLAVSPALKALGIPGRPRLFEVVQRVREVNAERRRQAPGGQFVGSSVQSTELADSPELEAAYITAKPRMALYMEYSKKIYDIYLKYIAQEDMHVYSVDEVFLDVTDYLATYKMTAHELAITMIRDVLRQTGVTATAGIGTNLYLSKIAMDVLAKKMPADPDGVRIAELDEMSYRRLLWNHVPLTDFWRVGRGYAKKLQECGLYTMGDIARCSVGKPNDFHNEALLYRLFGVNAELLVDHAWGWEPTTMAEIRAYEPRSNSISSGQVLQHAYPYEKARLIVKEMTDLLVLDLVDKKLVTDQMVLTLGYDVENLMNPEIRKKYHGEVTYDRYGRQVPKHAHGTVNLPERTASTRRIMEAVMELFDRIVNPELTVRRVTVTACRVVPEEQRKPVEEYTQMDLFTDYGALEQQQREQEEALAREKRMQQAVLDIKKKYGKNAVVKGMNLQEGGTTIERNGQIGGHKA